MKKSIIIFLIAAFIIAAAILWILSSSENFKVFDITDFAVILLLIAFAALLGYKRLLSAKRGEPAEDELSKKVMLKTSSLSFYISLYLWLAIGYFSDKLDYEAHTLIGAGIIGMAVIFAVCWLIFNFRGIRNE